MAEQETPGCYCDLVHMTCSVCKSKTGQEGKIGLNTYRHTFSAVCPADGETIIYRLEIRTPAMIHVEHIKTATALIKKGWHEQIADRLSESLGGDQVITAVHQGVEIETVRLSG